MASCKAIFTFIVFVTVFQTLVLGDEDIKQILEQHSRAIASLQETRNRDRLEKENNVLAISSLQETVARLHNKNVAKQHKIEELEDRVEALEQSCANLQDGKQESPSNTNFQNTTILELEIRVDQLEADLFDTQSDVLEIEMNVLDLDFRLQEVTETVLDHGDNITVNSQDISDIKQDIITIEDAVSGLDTRVGNIDMELAAQSDSAFLVSLSADVNIPDNSPVPFDVIQFDTGSNFDLGSYSYVAPVDGVYLFYGNLYCNQIGCAHYIVVEGDRKVFNNEAIAGNVDVSWSKMVVTQELLQGQSVWFETVGGNDIASGGTNLYTYFGGHLLFSYN